ncbi:MAG: PAS domain S-box protein [Nitrospiraceae bacterium]|nr:PAS domain S-box protein [Nitrospiraceae bacterium]
MWFVRKNGERVLCSLHATHHHDSTGKEYYLLVIQDITQRKKNRTRKPFGRKNSFYRTSCQGVGA